MPIIICALCALVIRFSWKKEKNIYNPLVLFFGMWGIIVFGASLHLFGLYKADDIVYNIIFLGLVFFLLGFGMYALMEYYLSNISRFKENRSDICEYVINEKAFYVLGFLSLFLIWKAAIPTINFLLAGKSLYNVRYILFDSIMQAQNSLLFAYLAVPFVHVMIHFSIINFLMYKNNKMLLLAIASIVGIVLTNGARLYLLYFFIDAIIMKLIYKDKYSEKNDKKRNKKSRRKNLYISLLSLVILTSIIYMTIQRKADIIGSIYRYAVGCIPHMSVRYQQFQYINQYTYGVTSYQGFLRPLFILFGKLGMNSQVFDLSETILNQWQKIVYIAPDTVYNFCVTPFMYFYVDFGILGVIVQSMIYGIICGAAYKSIKRNVNIKSLVLYLMIAQSLLVSFMRYQFTDLAFCLSFIYMNFVIQKKKKLV